MWLLMEKEESSLWHLLVFASQLQFRHLKQQFSWLTIVNWMRQSMIPSDSQECMWHQELLTPVWRDVAQVLLLDILMWNIKFRVINFFRCTWLLQPFPHFRSCALYHATAHKCSNSYWPIICPTNTECQKHNGKACQGPATTNKLIRPRKNKPLKTLHNRNVAAFDNLLSCNLPVADAWINAPKLYMQRDINMLLHFGWLQIISSAYVRNDPNQLFVQKKWQCPIFPTLAWDEI